MLFSPAMVPWHLEIYTWILAFDARHVDSCLFLDFPRADPLSDLDGADLPVTPRELTSAQPPSWQHPRRQCIPEIAPAPLSWTESIPSLIPLWEGSPISTSEHDD